MKCEEFGERLTATMREFFVLRFGGEWHASLNSGSSFPRAQCWLVNSLINAVFIPGAQKAALEVVRREFGTSVVAWKRPLQRCYFRLATSPAGRFLAQTSIAVYPHVPYAENWLIVTGTHKVRFIDSIARISYCCRKARSPAAHFEREAEARRFAERFGIPVPRILAHLSDDCLAEAMIVGTPLNRLTSSQERTVGLQLALKALGPLYEATSRVVDLDQYVAGIVSQVESSAESMPHIASAGAASLARTLGESFRGPGSTIELVRAHGDFQPGNILYDRGQIWLIDWEYSKDRSRMFDLMTYELRMRYTPGLAKRITRRAAACIDNCALDQLRLFVLESLLFECEQAAVAAEAAARWLPSKLAELRKALPALCNTREKNIR